MLTSQRVVDVIFRAFEVCAASQVRIIFIFKICCTILLVIYPLATFIECYLRHRAVIIFMCKLINICLFIVIAALFRAA